MKALTLKRSVYPLIGICFVSWLVLVFAGDISIFYTVSANIFLFSFFCLLGIGIYAISRNKIVRKKFLGWAVIAIVAYGLWALSNSDLSGGGCTEIYAGYDTGWSDVCMDDYRG
jgi:hypothetical membrane protein